MNHDELDLDPSAVRQHLRWLADYVHAHGSLPGGVSWCAYCDQDVVDGETYTIGVLFPFDQKRFGAPQGATRGIAYLLCSQCAAQDDEMIQEQIEEKIFTQMTVN